MRKYKIFIPVIIFLLVGFWQVDSLSKEDRKIVIGVALPVESFVQEGSIESYMLEAAEEKKAELHFEYASWDVETQTQQMDEFIQKKVDVIILSPVNAKSMLNPLKRAKEAGIPVINVNMKVDAVSAVYINTYVGSSSSEEGALAADLIIAGLGEAGGETAIIEGSPGSDPQIYRTQAFVERVTPHPEIVVTSISNGGWSRSMAKLIALDLARKQPKLKAIFCQSSDMAMGALEAIEFLKKENNIIVVGIGEGDEYLQALRDKRLHGLVTQPSDYEGKYAVYCAVNAAKGEELRPWYKDPVRKLTKDNVNGYKRTMD